MHTRQRFMRRRPRKPLRRHRSTIQPLITKSRRRMFAEAFIGWAAIFVFLFSASLLFKGLVG